MLLATPVAMLIPAAPFSWQVERSTELALPPMRTPLEELADAVHSMTELASVRKKPYWLLRELQRVKRHRAMPEKPTESLSNAVQSVKMEDSSARKPSTKLFWAVQLVSTDGPRT